MASNKTKYIHLKEIHNTTAAEEIVPELMRLINPNSVIDVGCGLGTWLKVFQNYGVEKIVGIEGAHLKKDLLEIDAESVIIRNLEENIDLDDKFDLVVSLEVAEHLSHNSADNFVSTLAKLGNVILFSAAIPQQGGQNHINEQWPSYWQEKFQKHNFEFYDVLREKFWNNEQIDWWYKQNIFLIIKKGVEEDLFLQKKEIQDLIHPELFAKRSSDLESILSGKIKIKTAARIFLNAITEKIFPSK